MENEFEEPKKKREKVRGRSEEGLVGEEGVMERMGCKPQVRIIDAKAQYKRGARREGHK